MESMTPIAPVSKTLVWVGRVISALPVLMMGVGGIYGLMHPEMMTEGMGKLGYPERYSRAIVLLEIACAVIYAIPQTAVLGAILLTGYLGGATASHVRVGEPFFAPIIVGVVVWLGIFLRDARLRALVPLRSR